MQFFQDIADFLSSIAGKIILPVLMVVALVLVISLVDRHQRK